jgi:hypothetical protein
MTGFDPLSTAAARPSRAMLTLGTIALFGAHLALSELQSTADATAVIAAGA